MNNMEFNDERWKETEIILCSAIWYKDLPTQTYLPINIEQGIVVCGLRHNHCIDIVSKLANLRTVQFASDGVGESVQGFLTNKNRFVDREEGYIVAKQQNQLITTHTEGSLHSEDLY